MKKRGFRGTKAQHRAHAAHDAQYVETLIDLTRQVLDAGDCTSALGRLTGLYEQAGAYSTEARWASPGDWRPDNRVTALRNAFEATCVCNTRVKPLYGLGGRGKTRKRRKTSSKLICKKTKRGFVCTAKKSRKRSRR